MERMRCGRVAVAAAVAVVLAPAFATPTPAAPAAATAVTKVAGTPVSVQLVSRHFRRGSADAALSGDGKHAAFVTPNFDVSPRTHWIIVQDLATGRPDNACKSASDIPANAPATTPPSPFTAGT